jgi:hypothetical protein
LQQGGFEQIAVGPQHVAMPVQRQDYLQPRGIPTTKTAGGVAMPVQRQDYLQLLEWLDAHPEARLWQCLCKGKTICNHSGSAGRFEPSRCGNACAKARLFASGASQSEPRRVAISVQGLEDLQQEKEE